jgi:hypothetical protein
MLEVLLGLRRDIPNSSFSLEFDDELPGCVHPATIGQSAAVEEGMLCKPQPLAYTASFSSLAGRNAIFLLALILMASPIAGSVPYVTPSSAPGGCQDRSDGFCRPWSSASPNRPVLGVRSANRERQFWP